MIKRICIENFKSLRCVELTLSNLNIFVGANSSGKSNFLDALRVLQGIGNGFTISEVLNGKPRTATSELWDGIRGGSEFAAFREPSTDSSPEVAVKIEVSGSLPKEDHSPFTYHITFSAKLGRVLKEWLTVNGSDIFDSNTYSTPADAPTLAIAYSKGKQGRRPKTQFERNRPVLHQFAEHEKARASDRRRASACAALLANVQRLDPYPDILRQYSAAHSATRLGEHGENFAALVSTIISDEQTRVAYMEWLEELSPADVDDVQVLYGALKEPLFAVVEGGKTFPAQVLSDGTLRFAAITAAFFQDSMPDILTLEEIEKGVHPKRLRLLIELLRSQTQRVHNQVIATTHSPEVVSWLTIDDLSSTFLCTREGDLGQSKISALNSTPHAGALLGKSELSEAFSEGWLESIA